MSSYLFTSGYRYQTKRFSGWQEYQQPRSDTVNDDRGGWAALNGGAKYESSAVVYSDSKVAVRQFARSFRCLEILWADDIKIDYLQGSPSVSPGTVPGIVDVQLKCSEVTVLPNVLSVFI